MSTFCFKDLHFLVLIITFSSIQCGKRNLLIVSGGMQESSQNGNYYGIISTPNFPQPFHTPYNQTWVIDASHHSNGTQINVYLTQMYLSKGVKFFQHPTLDFSNQGYNERPHGRRQICGKSADQYYNEIIVEKLPDILKVSTTCPYLEITVSVPSLYGYHYRTRDPFLFDVYGFNITFEIVPERQGLKNDSCSTANCNDLGHCYLAANWREFYCDCINGHKGKHCELSNQHCDPESNINFCYNGGKCRMVGQGDGYCDCSETGGYGGARCEHFLLNPILTAKTDCSASLDLNPLPCSCTPKARNGSTVPKDWVKYEAILLDTLSYPALWNESYIEESIDAWFKLSNLSVLTNVIVRLEAPPTERSRNSVLFVNFHGPYYLLELVRSSLNLWLTDKTPAHSQSEMSLLGGSFKIYTMPRLEYSIIEVSRKDRLKIGSPVSLTCIAPTGPSNYFATRDIRFRWFKDGMLLNTSLATRHMTVGRTYTLNKTMSILLIDRVSAFDGGLYTCEVRDVEFGDLACGMKDVEIILPPKVEVTPMSLTLERANNLQGVAITCTKGKSYQHKTAFIWVSGINYEEIKDVTSSNNVVTEDIFPEGKLLRILNAKQSESYTCIAYNDQGEEQSKTVEVKVLDSQTSPSCKSHFERLAKSNEILRWEWTALIYRLFSLYFRLLELQNCKMGFGHWSTCSGVRLLRQVERYIIANKILYAGEGEKIIALLEDIVKYNLDLGQVTGLFPVFFSTITNYLRVPNSVVQESSILTMCQIVSNMAVYGGEPACRHPHMITSDLLVMSTLCISAEDKNHKLWYAFPLNDDLTDPQLSWLKERIKVEFSVGSNEFPADSMEFTCDEHCSPEIYSLRVVAYRNLSSLLTPSRQDTAINFERSSNEISEQPAIRTIIELISPVIQISIEEGYYFPEEGHIKLQFNMSGEQNTFFSNLSDLPIKHTGNIPTHDKGTFLRCAVVENTENLKKVTYGKMLWSLDTCTTKISENGIVECQCDNLGIVGLIKIIKFDDDMVPESSRQQATSSTGKPKIYVSLLYLLITTNMFIGFSNAFSN